MVAGISTTISGTLISHARNMYFQSLESYFQEISFTEITNIDTHLSLPAFITSVASIEAWLNEVFLNKLSKSLLKDSSLWIFSNNWIEKVELGNKILLIPQLLFNKTLNKRSHPYQDMAMLIKVRNEIVHYKMSPTPPKFVNEFRNRGISPAPIKHEGKVLCGPWIYDITTSEAIRWAHNTVCATVEELISLIPEDVKQRLPLLKQSSAFKAISTEEVYKWFSDRNIKVNSKK